MQKELYKPKNNGTKTLFQNSLVERLTRTHILVPIVLLDIYSMFSIYWSITRTNVSVQNTLGIFILGIIAWTFTEYMMHKHVYHMSTHTSWRKRFQYNSHGVHHEYPKDKDRLAMPPLMSLTLATILLFVFYLIAGELDGILEINEDEIIPPKVSMQIYPNPFNPETTISFSLTTESTENTEINIYNVRGQKVKSLPIPQLTNSPVHKVIWNGKDMNGKSVSTGIYLFELKSGGKVQKTKKGLLLK